MIRTFTDSSAKAAGNLSASVNRLTNVWVDFVKQVLDSGAAQSIVDLFEALRQKLQDPYIMASFAAGIKYIADNFTRFVQSITKDDVRNGFDALYNAMMFVVKVIERFIEGIKWIMDHSREFGAIVGALAGAAVGTTAGATIGAIGGSAVPGIGTALGATGGSFVGGTVGAVSGAIKGYQWGGQLAPSFNQIAGRETMDADIAKAQAEIAAQRALFRDQYIPGLLKLFKVNKETVQGLFTDSMLTQKTLDDMARILADSRFKTDAARAKSLEYYAKVGGLFGAGVIIGPGDTTLKDVSQKGKADPEEKKLQATFMRSAGLNPNFYEEWNRLIALFKRGAIPTLDELAAAQAKLLDKQPFRIELLRQEHKEMEKNNKTYEDFIDYTVRLVNAQENLREKGDERVRAAGMYGEYAREEMEVQQEILNRHKAQLPISEKEIEQLRSKLYLAHDLAEVSKAADQGLALTVDKYKPQINQLQGFQTLLNNKGSGVTKQMVTDYYVTSDTHAKGTQEYLDAQKRSTEDYYAWVDGLRKADVISEQTAMQMKASAAVD